MTRLSKTAWLILPLMAACSGPVVQAQATEPAAVQRTISVSGTGKAFAAPDMASMNFAVVANGKTASDAMTQNASKMNAVRDELKKLGVEPRDMQTNGFYLNPIYGRDDRGRYDQSVITGYEARNNLSVRLRDISKVGETIDKAVSAGANSLGGLNFGFQKTDELINDARRNAVKDAKSTATLLADEAGVSLGEVISINIHTHSSQPVPMMRMESMAMADAAAPTPIEAGEGMMSVTVNMVYGLK